MSQLIIYANVVAEYKQAPGGYGVVLHWGKTVKEISQGYNYTSLNRMELRSVIAAMDLLTRDNLDIIIYSNCASVIKLVENTTLFDLNVKMNFKIHENAKLWLAFVEHYNNNRIKFILTKSDSDNLWINRCNILANEAVNSERHIDDIGYDEELLAEMQKKRKNNTEDNDYWDTLDSEYESANDDEINNMIEDGWIPPWDK